MTSDPVSYTIHSVGDAARAIEYFNAFHDSFILKLELQSHDLFEARGVQYCSGQLDLKILFAHYNYQEDRKPHTQQVQARFLHVADLKADFTGRSHEWTVYELEIRASTAEDPDEPIQRPLEAVLRQSRWLEGDEWERSEDLKFRFQRAHWKEI